MSIIPVFITGIISHYNDERIIEEHVINNLKIFVEKEKKEIENRINTHYAEMNLVSNNIKLLQSIENYKNSINKNINNLKKASEILTELCNKKNVAFWGAGRIFDSFVVNGGFEPDLLHSLVDKELPKYVDHIDHQQT